MESKINYTLVGIFIVVMITGLSGIAYWLEQHGGNQDYDYYRVYISESIAGLSPDASVKYRGVAVGTVESMEINPRNSEQVVLLLKIKKHTPIKEDAKAALKFFGITGLAYIELSGSSKDSPLLKTADNTIPEIPSIPSTFSEIDGSLRLFFAKSSRALDKFDRLVSDKNIQNTEVILQQAKLLTQEIRGQMADIHQLIENGIIIEKNMTGALQKIEAASISVDRMATSLEKNYANVGHNLNQDVTQSLELFNHLLFRMNNLTDELQTTVHAIDTSPSDLLFKHTELKPGPGEKGYEKD